MGIFWSHFWHFLKPGCQGILVIVAVQFSATSTSIIGKKSLFLRKLHNSDLNMEKEIVQLVLGSRFGIFGGFGWICSLILGEKPGFGKVQSSAFPDLGLGSSTQFWANRFELWAFWRCLKGFKFRFWWMNLGSKEFEAVRISLYLCSIQH